MYAPCSRAPRLLLPCAARCVRINPRSLYQWSRSPELYTRAHTANLSGMLAHSEESESTDIIEETPSNYQPCISTGHLEIK
jgi:hypothetical protein